MFEHIYSTDYLRELEPYLRLELLVGKNSTANPIPEKWLKQIKSLVISESENRRASLELQIEDLGGEFYDSGIFDVNQRWVVYIGYRTEFEKRGPFTITNLEPTFSDAGVQLKVSATEGGTLGTRVSRRVVDQGTLRDLFTRVALDNGMGVAFEGVSDEELDIPLDGENPIVQTGQTDGAFLTTIANKYGWQFTTTSGRVHITPALVRKTLGLIRVHQGRPDSSVTMIKVRYKSPSVSYVPKAAYAKVLQQVEAAMQAGAYYQTSPDGTKVRIPGLMTDARTGAIIPEDPDATPDDFRAALYRANAVAAGFPVWSFEGSAEEVYAQGMRSPVSRLFAEATGSDKVPQGPKIDTAIWTPTSGNVSQGLIPPQLAYLEKGRAITNDGRIFDMGEDKAAHPDFMTTLIYDDSGNITGIAPAKRVRSTSPESEVYGKMQGRKRLLRRPGKRIANGLVLDADFYEEAEGQGSTDLMSDADYEKSGDYSTPSPRDHLPKKKAGLRKKLYRRSKMASLSLVMKFGSPVFRPQHQLELVHPSKRIAGIYKVVEVIHKFGGGYATEIRVVSDLGKTGLGAKTPAASKEGVRFLSGDQVQLIQTPENDPNVVFMQSAKHDTTGYSFSGSWYEFGKFLSLPHGQGVDFSPEQDAAIDAGIKARRVRDDSGGALKLDAFTTTDDGRTIRAGSLPVDASALNPPSDHSLHADD